MNSELLSGIVISWSAVLMEIDAWVHW